MKTVAIFGVGLIGGSFALALRKAGYLGNILGVSSKETLAKAIEFGVIDAGVPLREAARDADLLYLSQPIHTILEVLPEIDPWVRPEALVTDAGSTKRAIVEKAHALKGCQFLGGHPLAGKESRGVESADADLFLGRTYVLTPTSLKEMETGPARELLGWIKKIGSTPVVMDAAAHDRTIAYTSHLPQLASTALASLLANQEQTARSIFGPGLLDSTRLALSAYDIWRDILSTNHCEIDHAITSYITLLERLKKTLNSEQIKDFFDSGAEFASSIRSTP